MTNQRGWCFFLKKINEWHNGWLMGYEKLVDVGWFLVVRYNGYWLMVADGCWWIAGNDLQAVHQTSKVASTCNFLGCSKENRNWLKNTGDRKSLPLSHLGWSANAGRIFFACTVAFSIPISKLLSVEALWKGPRWWGGMYSHEQFRIVSWCTRTLRTCQMCTIRNFFRQHTQRNTHTHASDKHLRSRCIWCVRATCESMCHARIHHGHRPLHPNEGFLRPLHGRCTLGHRLGHGGARRVCATNPGKVVDGDKVEG